MRLYILIFALFITSPVYAGCVDSIDDLNENGELYDVLRCLQSSIDSIKMDDSFSKQQNVSNKYWAIQVAASIDKSDAEEVAGTFKGLGYITEIRVTQNTQSEKKRNWYKVLIGKYTWKSEATVERKNIQSYYPRYKDSFVISFTN